jgi:hypothetical protein
LDVINSYDCCDRASDTYERRTDTLEKTLTQRVLDVHCSCLLSVDGSTNSVLFECEQKKKTNTRGRSNFAEPEIIVDVNVSKPNAREESSFTRLAPFFSTSVNTASAWDEVDAPADAFA